MLQEVTMDSQASSKLDLLSTQLKELLAESSSIDVENFFPDDFLRVILEAVLQLQLENAPNLIYLLAKALSSEDEDTRLQVETISFKLLHLMLLSVVEKRMEVLDLCSMELLEELEIVEWNKESFLPGLNEILFPSRSVYYKMVPMKLRSKRTFVLKKRSEDEDDDEEEGEEEEEMEEVEETEVSESMSANNTAQSETVNLSNIVIEPYDEEEECSEYEEETEVITDVYISEDVPETPVVKQEKLLNPKDVVPMLKCLQCNVVLKEPDDMMKHVKQAHGDSNTIILDNAAETTPDKAQIEPLLDTISQIKAEPSELEAKPKQKRQRRPEPDPSKTCQMCTRQFPTVSERDEHVAKASCLTCSDCSETYKTKDEWIEHHRTKHGKKQSICPFCNKGGYRSCHLLRHIDCVHYNIRKHRCEHCGRGFFEKKDRVKHEKTCVGSQRTCSICSETLANPLLLKDHVKSIHNLFLCKHCGEHTESAQALRLHCTKKHWKEYNDDADHICEQCGKVCKGMLTLKRHVKKMHSNQPQVSVTCHICNKMLNSAHYLKRHIAAVHEKIKNYCCEICGKGFSSSAHLQEHVGIHDNIKRYTCETCGEGFIHRASFKRHTIKHLGNQLFPCSICHRKFDTPCYLKNHVKRVHRGSSVEVINFQYPGTTLPKHMRKRLQGGRAPNKLQSELIAENQQIEIAMTTAEESNVTIETVENVARLVDKAQLVEASTVHALESKQEQNKEEGTKNDEQELDLAGIQLVQVEEEGETKVFCVPEGAQYIEIGDSTISLENAQFPVFM